MAKSTYKRVVASVTLFIALMLVILLALLSPPNGSHAQTPVPASPTGLTAPYSSISNNSVTLTWDDPEDGSITGYQVLRRSRDGEEFEDGRGAREFVAVVEDTGTAATTYTDSSVTAHTRYVYRVKARNSAGLSGQSSYVTVETLVAPPVTPQPASTVPAAPTGLTAPSSWISDNSVTLTWDDPVDSSITGYRILRRDIVNQPPGTFTAVTEDTGSTATSYVDNSVEPETRYAYRVKAINSAGTSAQSGYVNVETTAAPPEPAEPILPEPAPRAGAIWLAMMQVAELGQSEGHFYFGQSSITHAGALSPAEFQHEGLTNTVYALGFSEAAQSLRLAVKRPLPTGLALRVGGLEFAVAEATSRSLPSGTGTMYAWQATGLNWAVDDEVAVYLVPTSNEGPVDSESTEMLPSRPNVVVILADDLGWGDVQSNNPDSAMTTPRMDSIASAGARFSDAHSSSSACTGTRYGLLTGRYSWRSWMTAYVLNGYDRPLIGPDRPTLGTLLQGHGYRTAAVGKWHLGMDFTRLSDIDEVTITNRGIDFDAEIVDSPIDHGFDEFFGVSANNTWRPQVYIRNDRFAANPDKQRSNNSGVIARWQLVLDRLTGEAVSFIERSAATDSPFFLYLPLSAPHEPIVPAARFRNQTDLGSYGDFVAHVDSTVGEVLDTLDRVGALENTIVILTSDNGSFMGRSPNHISIDHTQSHRTWTYRVGTHQSNGDWNSGKGSIYEGGHRIPLLLQWPAAIEAGSTLDATVSLTDLYSTLADIVGDEPAPGVAPDSVSLLPLLLGETDTRGEPIVHHSSDGTFAIRDGRWKLIFNARKELYDLEQDPGETNNLRSERPEVLEQLETTMARIRSAEDGTFSSDATLRSLRIAGVDIGTFDPNVRTYAATVAIALQSVEVMAIPTVTDTRVTIDTPNGILRYGKPGRGRVEVRLADSTTTITARVLSQDQSVAATYTVRVTRPLPTISGTVQVGETLSADTSSIADADGLTNPSYSYQWIRNDGSADSDVAGATSPTYTLAPEDQGKTIKVRVNFTDDAGNAETRTSEETAAVLDSPNAPRGLTVDTGSSGELSVTWQAPDNDGGSEVTGYAVQWKESSGSWHTASDVSETTVTGTSHTIAGLTDGTEYAVRVRAVNDVGAGQATAQATAMPVDPPLTAGFLWMPASHNASDEFWIFIEFSEEITSSGETLRDHALTVTGGEVVSAAAFGASDLWWVIIDPDGNGDVTITLPITTECSAAGAVCTDGRKKLSNRIEYTISGQGG